MLNDDWIDSRVPSGRQANKLKICKLEGRGDSRDGTRVGAVEGENRGKGLKGRWLWWCPEDGRGVLIVDTMHRCGRWNWTASVGGGRL